MDKQTIITKLQGIKAKINDPALAGTPEQESAIWMFAKLMTKYNVSLSEVDVKISDIKMTAVFYKDKIMESIAIMVADLTDTRITKNGNSKGLVFYGNKSDVDYADWLFRTCQNHCAVSFLKYQMTMDYYALVKQTSKANIERNFNQGWYAGIAKLFDQMQLDKQPIEESHHGNALMVIKSEKLNDFEAEHGVRPCVTKSVAVRKKRNVAAYAMQQGFKEGESAILHHQMQ